MRRNLGIGILEGVGTGSGGEGFPGKGKGRPHWAGMRGRSAEHAPTATIPRCRCTQRTPAAPLRNPKPTTNRENGSSFSGSSRPRWDIFWIWRMRFLRWLRRGRAMGVGVVRGPAWRGASSSYTLATDARGIKGVPHAHLDRYKSFL